MKLKNFYTEHEPFILGTGFIVALLVLWESIPLWYYPTERNGALLHHPLKNRCHFL